MADEAKCGNCYYWRKHPQFDGTCHRYAPRPDTGIKGSDVIWPTMRADGWCGEWQELPGEPQVVF